MAAYHCVPLDAAVARHACRGALVSVDEEIVRVCPREHTQPRVALRAHLGRHPLVEHLHHTVHRSEGKSAPMASRVIGTVPAVLAHRARKVFLLFSEQSEQLTSSARAEEVGAGPHVVREAARRHVVRRHAQRREGCH